MLSFSNATCKECSSNEKNHDLRGPVAATDILINPRAIARDVYECYKNGASMVHLHCRDLNGNLTPDLSLLEETVAYIREMCDIVVEDLHRRRVQPDH